MFDMISKHEVLKVPVSELKDHVNKDVFSKALIPLSMQVQKKIVDIYYVQCETSGTRIVFYNIVALEQDTFMESPNKKFCNV